MPRILYVDHVLAYRTRSTLTIWQLGYWNDVVATLERALSAVKRRNYDLIFLDLAMPGTDIWAAAREIRTVELECGHLPSLICALSAIDEHSLRQASYEAGMQEFIGNPATQEDLCRMIRLAETTRTGTMSS